MSREADKKIADVLAKFDVPFAGNVWRVQGTPVIYHKTLEEIAAKLGIIFQSPTVLRAERDECVMLVHGSMQIPNTKDTRHEWSVGEALVNVNYRVTGKQAAYVYAMAEKRAKDRVILKLIDLAGHVYSEEEADDFKVQNADRQDGGQGRGRGAPTMSLDDIEYAVRKRVAEANTVDAVTDVMLSEETQQQLAQLSPGARDDVREFAKLRLVDLGWKPSSGAKANGSTRKAA